MDEAAVNTENETTSSEQQESPKGKKRTIGTILALGLAFLAKFKSFFFLLFKLKSIFTTGLSMILMIFLYSFKFGVLFALGFVLLIFVHEMGHAIMLKIQGGKFTAPIFIPFVGAFIALKELPKNVAKEAEFAIGGPLLGLIGALVCYTIYCFTNSEFWLSLSYLGFFLNLFNLTPVSPLDGGRIVAAISRLLWIPGFIILAVEIFFFHNPILIIIFILGLISFFSKKKPEEEANPDYYKISPIQKATFATGYFALLIILGYLSYMTHEMLLNMGS